MPSRSGLAQNRMPDTDILACPLDQSPLTRVGNSWVCAENHSYDRARQGYINLLPVQFKRSKDPGDSKAMVQARRSFLHRGHYQPISDALNEAVTERLSAPTKAAAQPLSILDAGCGEGYYLQRLKASLGSTAGWQLLGLDISKWAILAAAKSDSTLHWLVGTNAHLPIQTQRLDALLCLFGFPVYSEFERVLKPGGLLIKLDPGPEHLIELRQALYERLEPFKSGVVPAMECIARQSIGYRTRLDESDAIDELIRMTPHAFRAPAAAIDQLTGQGTLEVTVDVDMVIYQTAS